MSRFRVVLTAAAVAVLVVFGAAAPASAHDELLASTPPADARLEAAPTEVSLTFSADVMTIGAAVIVVDASGRDWAAGEPTIDRGTVTVPVDEAMPAAGYEIRWRVVSSDGHPISGLIPFAIGDGEPLTRTAAPDASTAASDVDSLSTQENQGALRVILIGVGGAAVAVALFALIRFLRRPRTAVAQPGDTPPDAD